MEPISFETKDPIGVNVLPALFTDNQDIDAVIGRLTKSELEAVERIRDQFHSKAELREFVRGLRAK